MFALHVYKLCDFGYILCIYIKLYIFLFPSSKCLMNIIACDTQSIPVIFNLFTPPVEN